MVDKCPSMLEDRRDEMRDGRQMPVDGCQWCQKTDETRREMVDKYPLLTYVGGATAVGGNLVINYVRGVSGQAPTIRSQLICTAYLWVLSLAWIRTVDEEITN